MAEDTPRKRPRSPSYPSIPLGRAVERTQTIYENEGKNLAPVAAILKHWGYNAMGGRALRQIAALKKFGLVEEEGSRDNRQVKLTDLALDIVTPGSPKRADALQIAALKPAIHQELRQRYPDGLPSDDTVRFYLERERDFHGPAATELLREYRATMKIAGLDAGSATGDTVGDSDDPDHDNDTSQEVAMNEPAVVGPEPQARPPQASGAHTRSVSLPLAGEEWVQVTGAFPLSDEAWDQMLAMLTAMKPGLTRQDDD